MPAVRNQRSQKEARKMLAVLLREDQWMAQRLHDTFSQSLCGMQLLVSALKRRAPEKVQEFSDKLQRLDTVTDGIIEELHQLIAELRCEGMDSRKLSVLLTEVAKQFSARVPCRVALPNHSPRIGKYATLQLFCVIRDLIDALARDQGVSEIVIRLDVTRQRGLCTILEFKGTPRTALYRKAMKRDLLRLRAKAVGATLSAGPGAIRILRQR